MLIPQVVPSTFAEDLDKGLYRNGAEYAKETALQKAREVASRPWDKHDQPSLVIAADTVVELKGNVLEKPQDAADAACMLTRCGIDMGASWHGGLHALTGSVMLTVTALQVEWTCSPRAHGGSSDLDCPSACKWSRSSSGR